MVSHDTAERLREAASSVFADARVVCAYLFGSVARGEAHTGSDIDVAVLLDEDVPRSGAFDLSLRLSESIERAVGAGPVEVVVLNEAPLPLLGRVLRDGVVLFSRDEARRVRFQSQAVVSFLDFDIHARRLDEQLLRSIAEGRR